MKLVKELEGSRVSGLGQTNGVGLSQLFGLRGT